MEMDILLNISPIFVWLVVLVLSMFPVIEARFAIPLGVSSEIWGSGTLEVWQSMLAGIIGSTLIGILLIISYKPMKRILSKSKIFGKVYNVFVLKLLAKFNAKKANKVVQEKKDIKKEKRNYKIKFWSILLFLILPVPGSGVWSCALLGSLLGLKIRDNILIIVLGNIISCFFIAVLSAILIEYITLILIIAVIMALMYVFYKLIEKIISNKKKKEILV